MTPPRNPNAEFTDYILDLLEPMGNVRARRMFGGVGLFKGELMFGIIDDNTLYFKVDDSTQPAYEADGMSAFTYLRQGKECALRYYQVPPEVLEDEDELNRWARTAFAVAERKGKKV